MLKRFNLKLLKKIPGGGSITALIYGDSRPQHHVHLFNLDFCGQMGAGPGVDKNGTLFNLLKDLGLSFVDIGPVTGENVISIIKNINRERKRTILSVCIKKDHVKAFSLIYDFVDMFDIEVSEKQAIDVLGHILDTRLTYDIYKPVVVRIMGNVQNEDLYEILDFCLLNGVDGIIAATEEGVRKVYEYTQGRFPIIGYGGIRTPKAAQAMLEAGASLIQVTTAIILDGPSRVRKINRHLNSISFKTDENVK